MHKERGMRKSTTNESIKKQKRSLLILCARKKLTITITKEKEILPCTRQKKLFKNHEKVS
jgi:hypothetical protein